MSDLIRISAKNGRDKVASGSATLVCAYEGEEELKEFQLEGAISLNELNTQLSAMGRDRELIFYCA